MNALTQALQASGLNPTILDENTDMSTLPTLNADATPEQSQIDRFAFGAKMLQKAFAKAATGDQALADQRAETKMLRDMVTKALDGNGDFDAASKAFKAASNKLDKLIDARNSNIKDAKAGVDALQTALSALKIELEALED